MSTARLPSAPTPDRGTVVYPDTDPEPMAESPIHFLAVVMMIATLREWFRARTDIYVIGNVFWYYEEGNPLARKAPDLMVIKGVDPRTQRHSYKDWEGGARPCFILEVLSDETFQEDLGLKRELYERLGVREYFLFDPEKLTKGPALVGYRLIGGVYEPLPPAADGSLPSAEMGLRVRPDGERLAFLNPRTLERVPDPPALAERLAEVQRELDEAARERDELERLRERERQEKERERQEKEAALRLAEEERRQRDEALQLAERAQRERAEVERQRQEAEARAEKERQEKEQLLRELERLRAGPTPPAAST